ncbi:AraC family transcriptional regulator N-terminal domain-containing protein [Vacuolonema iberomarrocanum]|uniref:AraC family transcriptional regulator n=1 Tax=Vacuolonema iberomarrocanum TaxID=3454632 RepID=UPI0019EA07D9|nr:AraC family transcriptional regulator [filamentous cyanobacterium LEGE 07170]
MSTETINHDAMVQFHSKSGIANRCAELATRIARHTEGKGNGAHPTAIAQLELIRDDASTNICSVYKPTLAVIVQGKKELMLGEKAYRYGVGQYVVVSVDLAVRGSVIEASPEKPYLCFLLELSSFYLYDVLNQIQSDILDQIQSEAGSNQSTAGGLFASDVDLPLLDCALRLTQLLDTPRDMPFLAPTIIREIYYRLLTGDRGALVRQIATSGSSIQRVAEVIKLIKADFSQSLRVEALAEQANMSVSSFHRHFKTVTSMSPLKYQKHMRLVEARRLMLTEDADATQAAYQVGYESPSQFSREYSRMFGAPPVQDIQRLRIA